MGHWWIAILALSGCVISDDDVPATPRCGDGVVDSAEQCDDGNDVADDGCTACLVDIITRMVDVTWQFELLATETESTCPAGFPTAEVSTVQVDELGVPLAAERIDPFPCELRAGGIPFEVDHLGGLIDARVRFLADNGEVYAESLTARVDISEADQAVAFTLYDDAGYLSLGWKLHGATCADVDEIVVTTSNAMHSYVDRFACDAAIGITAGVVEGVYDVTIAAVQGGSDVTSVDQAFTVVGDRNRVTPLGVIDLVIPGS